MNKILLAAILAVTSIGASAAVIDNDLDQVASSDLQVNGIIDASILSVGPTNVIGTNLVNTGVATTLGLTAAAGNDVNQTASFIGQGNGVLSLNAIDLGNTNVTGINSVNASTQTAGSAGLVAITFANETNQSADFILQGNGVANGALLSIGNITVDGTNLVNTSQQTIGGLGIVSVVAENDINQTASVIGQGNGVLDVGFAKAGNINVTGINAVNSASQTIGSLGFLADGVVDNDIRQSATDVGQTNGATTAAIINIGNVNVDGTNLVNVADKTTFAAGLFQGVAGNDINQSADSINQSNTVTSLSGLGIGNVTVDGTNAVNVATANTNSLALLQIVDGNEITQNATAIRQDNEILVGAVIRGGNLTVNGNNVVNQASHEVNALALAEGVTNNSITQNVGDVVQSNRIGVLAGANVGRVAVNGSNSINSANLDIEFGVFGIAAQNDVTQTGSGLVQYNAIGSVAGVQAGPLTVNGTNSINSANLSVVQGIPTP